MDYVFDYDYVSQVCVARWNSEASSDSLVTQDLVQGEGQAVNIGDTVEVAYSGWLLQNHTLGQVINFNFVVVIFKCIMEFGQDKLHCIKNERQIR